MKALRMVALCGLLPLYLMTAPCSGQERPSAQEPKETTLFQDDFESGGLAGWETSGGQIEVVQEGKGHVCKIASKDAAGNTWLTRELPVDELHGKRVYIHCRYRMPDFRKGEEQYSGVGITLVHIDAGTDRTQWSGGPVFRAEEPTKWTNASILVDLVTKVKEAKLRIGFQRSSGTLFLDDIHLTVGPQQLPPVTDEVIGDNLDAAFTKAGDWNVSTKVPGFWGGDYLWHAKGDGSAKATWTLIAPDDGRWQVDARWTWGLQGAKDRATNAPFGVTYPSGSKDVRVSMADDQQAARFNPLAVVDLKKGETVQVTVSNDADNSVVADAARLVRLPDGCAGAELLYENTFSGTAEESKAEQAKDWMMEGGGIAEWADGYLQLRAKNYTVTRSRTETDHLVYWLKRDFPADFAVEWDFRFPDWSISPNGLAIIFICAKGVNGEDIFDPKLAKREGVFARYINGDINSYHLSYFAGKRGKANVRKNSGFYLVTAADDLVAKGGPDKWHRLRLTRFGPDLELSVNGQRCITWTDDGETYGPVHGGGKIGLRQQNDLFHGDYTNLRVYALKKE